MLFYCYLTTTKALFSFSFFFSFAFASPSPFCFNGSSCVVCRFVCVNTYKLHYITLLFTVKGTKKHSFSLFLSSLFLTLVFILSEYMRFWFCLDVRTYDHVCVCGCFIFYFISGLDIAPISLPPPPRLYTAGL